MSTETNPTIPTSTADSNAAEGANPTKNSEKRPADATEEASANEPKKRPKLTKKEAAKNHNRRPRGYDVDRDDRDITPHEGSYANPAQQELFGVTLEDAEKTEEEAQDLKKRKVALFLGFLGTKYGGFQINIAQRTLQAEIELALYRAGMLTKLNFGHPHKYSWSSSARTDKGVHACAQLCSLKVELLESDLDDQLKNARERLQAQLPDDIQVLDILRTTRNFCAKTQRDRVRYQYMVPAFLLHPDYRGLLAENGIPLEGRKEVAKKPLSEGEVQKLQGFFKGYRSSEEQRKLLQEALKQYEGTHSFHNFTRGMKPGQAQAKRFIETFEVQEPVVLKGVEWIPTQVLGQSFLLHQIRKMICLAVDVARGTAPVDVVPRALSCKKQDSVQVALAPAQGLFLEMSYFGGYNRRKGSQNKELPNLDFLKQGEARDRWEAFRTTIRQHIVDEEVAQGNFLQYLYQQECLFQYKRFYRLDGNTSELESEGNSDEE